MRSILLLGFALLMAPDAARCGQEPVQWGARVSDEYDLWGWITSFADEDERTWDSLPRDQRNALLKKASDACSEAGRDLASCDQSDGDAILALSHTKLARMEACRAGGEAAAGLKEKRLRLSVIRHKAAAGRFDQADLDWLRDNGITMRLDKYQSEKLTKDQDGRSKQSKQTAAAADKKYAALKGGKLDAAGLSKAYDGGKAGAAGAGDAVALSGKHNSAPPDPGKRAPQKKLAYTPPPDMQLSEEFKGMKGYAEIKKENPYTGVMAEVDKDGEAAVKKSKIKAAGYATLKSVYSVSKDFDETFVNNPSPKNEDVSKVIDRIKSKAKNPQEAWEIAYQMRNQRDFPALRDAEHYLWACSEASESKWKATRTIITTPMYSAAKLPGLRKIFFDDNASPPSVSEIKWGWKGATDCVK